MYAERTQYLECQPLLVELHTMIAAGQGDSDAAMDLRDRLVELRGSLSPPDHARLDALSGDLSMLHDHEIPDPAVMARVPASEVPPLLMEAFRREDWDEVLTLLRVDTSEFLKLDQVAYMRARAYDSLREFWPAIAFMDEAARRNPSNPEYASLSLGMLWAARRYEEAYARAKRILDDSKSLSRGVAFAGGILVQMAQQPHPPADLSEVVRASLNRIDHALQQEGSPNDVAAARVMIGLLALHLSEDERAAVAWQWVVDDQTSLRFVPSRGLLLQGIDIIRRGNARTPEGRVFTRGLAAAFSLVGAA